MRNASFYSYRPTSGNSLTLGVGDHTLQFDFRWPEAIQEQWDIVQHGLKNSSLSDPIIREDGSYDRTYDCIPYYTSIPDYGSGMEEWWNNQTEYPQSLRNLDEQAVYNILMERKELYTELKEQVLDLDDQLVYLATVTDETGDIMTFCVRPGAYIKYRDSVYSFRIVSELARIGKDDLSKMTIEVVTYEFI